VFVKFRTHKIDGYVFYVMLCIIFVPNFTDPRFDIWLSYVFVS